MKSNTADFYIVSSVSRRRATLLSPTGEIISALTPTTVDSLVVGDFVTVGEPGSGSEDKVIESVMDRVSLLSRSYLGRTKLLAANLEHLFIVTAVGELFSAEFIDRTVASCEKERIPFTVVVNKSDKTWPSEIDPSSVYHQLKFSVLHTSTKTPGGLDELREKITEIINAKSACPGPVAFCGVSGVGKSSILNYFVPNSRQKVAAVSTGGQGKQTTSMASLYETVIDASKKIRLIDLPGLQHFGVCHITLDELSSLFTEMSQRQDECQFLDCSHTEEPHCAIKKALDAGQIAPSRYQSYLRMREEIRSYARSIYT